MDGSIARCTNFDRKIVENHPKSTGNRHQIYQKRPPGVENRSSGTLWGARGVGGRKWVENVDSCYAPRGFIWGRFWDLGRPRADIFSVFGCPVGGRRDDRRFDGKKVLTRTAQCAKTTIKTMVFDSFH